MASHSSPMDAFATLRGRYTIGNLQPLAWLVAAIIVSSLLYKRNAQKYPRVGNSKLWTWIPTFAPMRYSLEQYANQGYLKFHKALRTPFVMTFFDYDYLMLPPKYLDDLKRASFSSLSFNISFSDAFNLGASVGDLYSGETMGLVVTGHLNKQLKSLTSDLVEEVNFVFDRGLGRPTAWKEVVIAKLSGDLIHRVTNRILVGKPLCRDEKFLETSNKFTSTLLPSAVWTNFMSFGPFRDIASRYTTFFHKSQLEASIRLLLPTITQRLENRERGSKDSPKDCIEWTIEVSESLNDPQELAPRRIAENVLHLLFAANSAPGALVTQMMYQVLMCPEYLKPLRDEIAVAISTEGAWTSSSLEKMPQLDSFVRETLRVYPPGSIACTRTVVERPFALHDGTTLPIGSRFAFPVLAIQTDPDNYVDANKFDGFRFIQRSEDGEIQKLISSSSTVTPTFLPFGYGKHACPGRFFGILEAKLVFGKLLHEYDFKWLGDVKERPANISIEGMVPPHQKQPILIRSRQS